MNIALIGTGLMGQALAEHLLDCQHDLTVYNRSTEKAQQLQQIGASLALDAQTAVNAADTILMMLSDADAIHAVLDSIDLNSLNHKMLIQMGTIAPDESREIAKRIRTHGGRYLECPVLGSLPEARSGTLILMAGGEQADYAAALPLLEQLGKQTQLIGDVGQGATVKLAMNQLIAGLTATFSLSLALVEKEQIDVDKFMSIVRDSALYAPTFDKKLDRMLQRDYSNPNFPTKHLAKDTRLFLSVAEQLGLDTRALEGIKGLLETSLEMGLADTDYAAIYAAISPEKP
jgi:3-hydroxyisobutyrate dehydrogenase